MLDLESRQDQTVYYVYIYIPPYVHIAIIPAICNGTTNLFSIY